MPMIHAHLPRLQAGLAVQPFDRAAAVQITTSTGDVCVLEGPEAQVVQALSVANDQAPGSAWSVAQLAAHLGWGQEALWAVLDGLGDRGLLAQRTTPPSQDERASPRTQGYLMGRRSLALMGLATAAAPMAMASTVAQEATTKDDATKARPAAEAEQKQQMKAQESKRKRMSEQSKKTDVRGQDLKASEEQKKQSAQVKQAPVQEEDAKKAQ
jgi:hypothetical protein